MIDRVSSVLDFLVKYAGIPALVLSLYNFIYTSLQHRPKLKGSDPVMALDHDARCVFLDLMVVNHTSLDISITSAEYRLGGRMVPNSHLFPLKDHDVYVTAPRHLPPPLPYHLGGYEGKRMRFVFDYPDMLESSGKPFAICLSAHGKRSSDIDSVLRLFTSRGKRKIKVSVSPDMIPDVDHFD